MSAPAAHAPLAAGRVCPADYTYSPGVFARRADFSADTLYVVGGLYGNLAALAEIERMAAAEREPVTVVFNGDYHWFDAETDRFAAIERGVAPHRRMRGNVETELARPGDIGAGCGCAYPDSVDAGAVERSNEILSLIRDAVPEAVRAPLAHLPMHLVASVGLLRIGIVHGDAAALAGWRFAQDELDNDRRLGWLADVRRAAQVDVFTCTHTCLAALRDFDLPAGRLSVINNGAAGMPNFAGEQSGLITRTATSPSPHLPRYGLVHDGVFVDALAVRYDQDTFVAQFLSRWPGGSPAHASYFDRIVNGPAYSIERAAPKDRP
jgi:hypothetical protein